MRKHYTRILAALIIVLFMFIPTMAFASPSDYNRNAPETLQTDQLYGESALVMDASTGDILFSKNAEARMYPASTTKIMTLLLACESGWSMDMQVTIPAEAADIPADSSLVPVYPGETMAFGDLLYGMMMHSGNDGANAIAVLVGGSIENFVSMMNTRAAAIGCTGTHFANAHGYHTEDHYTTALDLARIAQTAIRNESFRTISATYQRTITIKGGNTRTLDLVNRNVMLNPSSDYYLEGCIGIKTGSHNAAGQCFVGAIDKDDVLLITVSLKCAEETQKWVDTSRLSRYAYTQYIDYPVEQLFGMITSQIATTRVANASSKDPNGGVLQFRLAQVSDANYTKKVHKNDPNALTTALKDFSQRITISLDQTPVAPITQGQALGTFTYTKQNGEVITATLIAGADIAAQPSYAALLDLFPFLNAFDSLLVKLLCGIIVLIIVVLILALRAKKRREEKRRMELYRRRRNAYRRRDNEKVRTAERAKANAKRSAERKKSAAATQKKRKQQAEMNDEDFFDTFE